MTSAAQELANRSNAQKSTGPRTAQGKAAVTQNAVQHGLLAKEVVIKGEDPGEFEFYRDQMLAELAPAGQMESMLAQRIVGLSWRLRRAERLQTAAFDKVEDQSKPPELVLSPEQASRLLAVLAETGVQPPVPMSGGPAVGRRAVQDFAQERILDRLLVYERRIEHSLYRTIAELRNLRRLREQGGVSSEQRRAAEAGLARSTGIPFAGLRAGLPVSSMGVPPMTVENIYLPTELAPAEAGDARETHGQDAHATRPPEGGTPNESCETNPIDVGANEGGTPNGGEAQKQSCETNPIREPGSMQSNTFSEPRRIRRFPNPASEMTYDSYLGRWVPKSVALGSNDSNRANLGRRE
ncbi:MAG: hypothetical protein NTZ17_08265 [Phycisphaerae bacterium]|nr:hypothetical protein [Phycisphaerae bacterium]